MPTINIKNVTDEAYDMTYDACSICGLVYAEYLTCLAKLHQACRAIADAGDHRL